jgi:hypothetical protein
VQFGPWIAVFLSEGNIDRLEVREIEGASPERARIKAALAQAVAEVHAAKTREDRAILERRYTEPHSVISAAARKQVRCLIRELNKHRKEHGC